MLHFRQHACLAQVDFSVLSFLSYKPQAHFGRWAYMPMYATRISALEAQLSGALVFERCLRLVSQNTQYICICVNPKDI